MRKWNAKDRALAAILAAPFAAVLAVGATSTETGGRLAERFNAAVAAASERWDERFGARAKAQAVETPVKTSNKTPVETSVKTSVKTSSETRSATNAGTVATKKAALPVLAPVAPKLTAAAILETARSTSTSQTAQNRPLTRTPRERTSNAETPEPDWTVAPDGTLERREARSPVDAGRVAVSTAPDGTRGGSAPSPPERTPNGLAPASPPVDLSHGAPVIPGTNDQWARGFDDRWLAVEKERRTFKPIADNSGVYALDSQRPGHTYGNHTERETALWAAETERLVVEGSLIFHDANLLGSKNGVSCDMCHPDAEGTHAETYPKYQVQLGRPALLRDMANWCLTQPCRGEPMSGDDPRMRALEAYMISARAGKTLEYGKR
ncbi:MAG: hypothetical protein IKK39_15195 [Thermoguttaceae bacterium]|nr:hypothetical protein [Thermoguttaceae bacterium]MBR4105387.1 hypothetical protein [Thermoguttaceae bacterium]